MRSRPMAPPASPTTRVWRGTTLRCAPCGSPTVRTRCTIAPLPDLNFGSMQKLRPVTKGSVARRSDHLSPAGRGGSKRERQVGEGVRKDEEFSGTRPVEERHRFDEMRLDGWMREHVEGYAGPLTVLQFKGGQSNPTYLHDTPNRS